MRIGDNFKLERIEFYARIDSRKIIGDLAEVVETLSGLNLVWDVPRPFSPALAKPAT
jgi:hypothetical protein